MAAQDRELTQFAVRLMDMVAEMRQSAAGVDRPASQSAVQALAPPATADTIDAARALLAQRQRRKQFLPASIFHEPAWEILLSLYIAHRRGEALSVKNLVALVDAPVTTSQRWIDQLVHMKLLQRATDPHDRRRVEISLSHQGDEAMERYLRSLMLDPNLALNRSFGQVGEGSRPETN